MVSYSIVPISELKPLEKVFPHHLKNLRKKIIQDGRIRQPLIADKETGIILDGSHRYVFLLMEGYTYAPVTFVDYNSQYISVGTSRVHKFFVDTPSGISKEEVIRRGLSGEVFHPRTTRHFFPFSKLEIAVDLTDLHKQPNLQAFHFLIADVTIQEEIAHNKKYLKEIDIELASAISYLHNAQSIKSYLSFQIEEMKKEL